MTVPVQNPHVAALANGATKVFPYNFLIFDAANLEVRVGNVVQSGGYTVTGVGNTAGGNVVFANAPAEGSVIDLTGATPYSRTTDYQNLGDLLAGTLNRDQDDPVLMIQQLAFSLSQTIKFNLGMYPAGNATLPVPIPGSLLGWSSDGTSIVNVGPSGLGAASILDANVANNAAIKATKLSYQRVGSGTVVRTVNDKLSDVVSVKDYGGVGDGAADDTLAIQRIEASPYNNVNLMGGTYNTSLSALTLTKNYFNGRVNSVNTAGNGVQSAERSSVPDTAFFHNRDKTPIIDWTNKKVLWLGTSIPHQGAGIDGYPELAAADLGFTVNNKAWSSSHASYDVNGNAFLLANMLSLSMTRDDVAAGLARYGAGSIYDPSFDAISKPDAMTCDFRIADQMTSFFDAVVLDHAHNDQLQAEGSYFVEQQTVTAVTTGAVTTLTLGTTGGISVGDAVILSFPNTLKLQYCARRVQAVSGGQININFNSTTVGAVNIAGATVYKVDRNTLRGAWNFLRSFIMHTSFFKFASYPTIVLAGAPSDYSQSGSAAFLRSTNLKVRQIALDFGLAFFDVAQSYDVQQRQQTTFFDDGTHPLTKITRQALANQWTRWMQGGANRQLGSASFLTTATGVTYKENDILGYDAILDAFTPRTAYFAPVAGVFSDDFNTNNLATNWTVTGASAWTASGMNANGSVNFTYVPAGAAAYISKSLAFSGTNDIQFDLQIPAGVLHPGAGVALTQIMSINETAGQHMGLNVTAPSGATSYGLQLTYFNSAGSQVSIPLSGSYSAGKHTVRVLWRKATATVLGAVKVWVDGSVVAKSSLDNASRGAGTGILLGVIFDNMSAGAVWQADNFTASVGAITSMTPRFTGATTFGTKAVTIVDGLITTVV